MDPPIINLTSFSAANPSSYSLAEIWPCPINGNVVGSGGGGGGLGLRMSNLTGFCDSASNRDVSMDESTVTEQSGSRSGARAGGRKRRDASSGDDESSNLSGNDLNNSDGKRMKLSRSRVENGGSNSKSKMESNSGQGNKAAEKDTKPCEQPNKQDYIHVRARRGQATDSHSLAERARREKIGERMKILQDLVPGCNKVIGKALVLDEIINYIQSLHHQVEFLSMKLEAVNSRMNSRIEVFPSKDLGTSTFDADAAAAAAGMIFGSQATREYVQGSQTEWLHMQVGSSFDRAA